MSGNSKSNVQLMRWYVLYENGQVAGAVQATESGIEQVPMQMRAARLGTVKVGEEPPVFTYELITDDMPFEKMVRATLIAILSLTAQTTAMVAAATQNPRGR